MGFLFLFLLGTAVALHLWKAGKASYYRITTKTNSNVSTYLISLSESNTS